ncbi:MAG: class I SAM-dependent methyltransferase [Deltaproteobacteria bacterium]|nr:class I SAM-dependent methyltransferase [Deltaproteobacteria bacterium]
MASDRFGKEYYQREFGLDELRRFNMHWWSVRFYGEMVGRWMARDGGRRFLDVGCAHGYTLAWLERRFETVGVDVSTYAVGRAREIAPRSRVFFGDFLGELPPEVSSGGFDAILAKYVLEHLPDPALALRRLAALLAPGGFLLFSVPNTESPGQRRKGKQWFGYGDETHCSLLAPSEWLRLTAEAGLQVERTFSDGLWDVPYVSGVPKALQYVLFSLPCIATVLLARPLLPARWGENLIVKARRSR